MVIVREERPEDVDAIRAVNDEAFGRPQEGRLVDALRANGGVLLSLVVVVDGRVARHILYSPAAIAIDGKSVIGAGLGPMVVLPEVQRQGIGRMLIERGNEALRATGWPFVVVLGHPEYYPRFGFRPASAFGIRCEWEVPDEVFMVLIMDPARKKAVSGLARYRAESSSVI